MDLSVHRQDVAFALQALEKAIERQVALPAHQPLWIELHGVSAGDARRVACEALASIDYAMEDKVRASVMCLGVIGTTNEQLRSAEAVNAAKLAFRAISVPLQRLFIRVPVQA